MRAHTQALEVHPRIQLSFDDLQTLTQEGKLLSSSGQLSRSGFRQMMYHELRDYICRMMGRQVLLHHNQRLFSSLFYGLNYLIMMQTADWVERRPAATPPHPSAHPLHAASAETGAQVGSAESALVKEVASQVQDLLSRVDHLDKRFQSSHADQQASVRRLEAKIDKQFATLHQLFTLPRHTSAAPYNDAQHAHPGAAERKEGTKLCLQKAMPTYLSNLQPLHPSLTLTRLSPPMQVVFPQHSPPQTVCMHRETVAELGQVLQPFPCAYIPCIHTVCAHIPSMLTCSARYSSKILFPL